MKAVYLFLVTFLALASSCAFASDPSPLQDFCVAINDTKTTGAVFVNGNFCKDPKLASANDFFFHGLKEANTSNRFGSTATLLTVNDIPGINTLGTTIARIDYAPRGLNPLHFHPRGSEILLVVEGTLFAGFVTSNPENRLFTKILNKGDVFVFPVGLIHFQLNVGKNKAVAVSGFSSQNPGRTDVANAVFGSNPSISQEVLTKGFQVDRNIIEYLQKQFQMYNSMIEMKHDSY
ncbi:hypothetical protein L6164_036929 [Bauhinia variegata]|uniref:Uncharacterized protein n=1 Tax=Bauhinia variegata TaxID=167791 RepID=A0ACB9KIN3_BAUVA|nr:hypothetical protein L6164_036929 [Bauhinia variegata]